MANYPVITRDQRMCPVFGCRIYRVQSHHVMEDDGMEKDWLDSEWNECCVMIMMIV